MQQDLKGMTLAELRKLNTQLDKDRLAEQEALRTDYLHCQGEYKNANVVAENDYEEERGRLIEAHRLENEALMDAYKNFGMLIGTLMDKRRFCDTPEQFENLRKEISETMEKRKEIRDQRRIANETFHQALHDIKQKHREESMQRYTAHEQRLREFRQGRIAIAKKYADLHEQVRQFIVIRKAEERAETE